MTMKYKQWREILSAINNEADLSKDNVIEKVKEKLKVIDSSAYEEWEKTDFDVNYLFQVGNTQHALLHLVACFGVNYLFQVGNTQYALLHLVACGNLKNVAGALLEVEGINVNAKEKNGWTPLHSAAQKGINVNAKEKNGWTPLHSAAQNGCREMMDILIAKGADPSLRNKDGKTPMDLILERKAIKNGIIAGSSVALLGAAIAVKLFATGTVAVKFMSVMAVADIVMAVAVTVGIITYSILEPITKMDETKEAQNVNGQEVSPN